TGVVKDDSGRIIEVRCTYDPATRGGDAPDGRKSKVTLHWVSAYHCIDIESRLYGRLFLNKNPMDFPEGSDFTINLNPESISIKRCKAEPSLKDVKPGDRFQFERSGYFVCDPDSKEGLPVFNLIVSLKDEWEKIKKFLT
ncbi:MAG TPA: glutamine--tRNA ligase, partial [bacterium]|nr:glutamine--tRNA ligase [bacterium]